MYRITAVAGLFLSTTTMYNIWGTLTAIFDSVYSTPWIVAPWWWFNQSRNVEENVMLIIRYTYITSWTDHVRNEEVLLRVNEQRNILHEISKRKANWIGHILRRNCLLKQVIEGKIKGEMEVTIWRGRRRRKLLDDLKDRRGYCHLKEEALDRTVWRTGFGRGFGPLVRQTAEWMSVY